MSEAERIGSERETRPGPGVGALVSVDEALAHILGGAITVAGSERVPTSAALGRVLVEDLIAGVDVPPADNSAVDGYAVRTGELGGASSTLLEVSQRAAAGRVPPPLRPGTAARIFTGAPVPAGADAVVMQEHCRTDGERVLLPTAFRPGDHIRPAGEDIRRGQLILPAGQRMRPQDVGLAASVGLAAVHVRRQVRVGILSTGDELLEPGQPARPGRIYDSNRYTLTAMLRSLDCVVIDRRIVADGASGMRAAIAGLAGDSDVVISTGGVCVGEEDHVRAAVEFLGRISLWGVAVKPGKPLAFGRVGEAAFLGLPGNPVAQYVAFCLFARPLLLRSQGVRDVAPPAYLVRAGFARTRPCARREYLRARIERPAPGEQRAVLHRNQGSGVLTSAVWSEGLAVIPEGTTVAAGDTLEFLPYSGLIG
jgi:molybdopterin molybdotransferase